MFHPKVWRRLKPKQPPCPKSLATKDLIELPHSKIAKDREDLLAPSLRLDCLSHIYAQAFHPLPADNCRDRVILGTHRDKDIIPERYRLNFGVFRRVQLFIISDQLDTGFVDYVENLHGLSHPCQDQLRIRDCQLCVTL